MQAGHLAFSAPGETSVTLMLTHPACDVCIRLTCQLAGGEIARSCVCCQPYRQSCWYWFLLARLFINVRWKPDNAVTIITINTIANITSGRLKPC